MRGTQGSHAATAAILAVNALLLLSASASEGTDSDYGDCYRECKVGDLRVCKFAFVEEMYNAMNAACGNCSHNPADCSLSGCVALDGVERTIYTINRQLPGPPIHVCKGDRVVVDLVVRLPGHAETMHWHGQYQRLSPEMDGVSMITQCPVLAGQTFRYDFIAEQAGTSFYHTHNGIHKVNGALGPMVVHRPREEDVHAAAALYDEDLPEHVVFLMDWIHVDAEYVFPGLQHPSGQMPVSALINGKGSYQFGDGSRTTTPLAEFQVTRGRRYRFRVVNSGGLACPMSLRVLNHTLTVIASDGQDVEPREVDTLTCGSGERYDFVLNADQPGEVYWMHAFSSGICVDRELWADQVAVLRYSDAPEGVLPAGARPDVRTVGVSKEIIGTELNSPTCGDRKESLCVTALQRAVPAAHDVLSAAAQQQVVMSVGFHTFSVDELFRSKNYDKFLTIANRYVAGTINNISFVSPPSPLLTQPKDVSTCDKCPDGEDFCSCTHVVRVELNTLLEIVLVDSTDVQDGKQPLDAHPMHLHGYSFSVLGVGVLRNISIGQERLRYVKDNADLLRTVRNADARPPTKDTVILPGGGYAILRVVADNPGMWFFHCHFQYHMASGMEAVFQVGEFVDFVQPPDDFPKCGNYLPDF